MASYNHIKGYPKLSNPCLLSPYRPSLHYTPLTITMSQNQSYWTSIETHLKQAIPLKHPLSVYEPMHHLVFAAPRNTAPPLCLAACELVGGHKDQAIPAASALHLMNAAIFTHQHLPLTDRPIIPHAFGPNIELLTGDGIIPFGFQLLAKSDDPAQCNSDRILRVIIEIARAIGSDEFVNGQYHDMLINEMDDGELDHARWINHVCEKKEGGLHACAAACGAILGEASEVEVEKLRKFGHYVGMAKGHLIRNQNKEKEMERVVEEMRDLALKELEHFKGRNIDVISSFVGL